MIMETGECDRCGTFTYLEKHHIWPKSIFHGFGKTVMLCSNCHTEYHKWLGNKNLENKDPDFHSFMFWKWYHTVTIVATMLVGVLLYLFW